MPTNSAIKSYKRHASNSRCKTTNKLCNAVIGCKLTRKTSKKSSYCRKAKNVSRKKNKSKFRKKKIVPMKKVDKLNSDKRSDHLFDPFEN